MAGNQALPSLAAFTAGIASGNYKVSVGRAFTVTGVTDGTSNSILLAEDPGRPDEQRSQRRRLGRPAEQLLGRYRVQREPGDQLQKR